MTVSTDHLIRWLRAARRARQSSWADQFPAEAIAAELDAAATDDQDEDPFAGLEGYEARKARESRRQRALSAAGRDIGDIPPVENRERREACRYDLRLDCETYHRDKFYLGWSADHLQLIRLMQQAILDHLKVVVAMPRGSGKTSLCVRAIEWAIRHGHRRFPFLVTAEAEAFGKLLSGIKTTFETSSLLLADFPELCYPIRCLNRSPQAARGQTCRGEPTYIEWGNTLIVLPTNYRTREEGNGSSIIAGAGITAGKIRGQLHTTPGGDLLRPDVAFFDDPQTRESARSRSQTNDRVAVMRGDVEYLGGPGRTLSCLAAVTVIQKQDMADRMLGEEFPDWRPVRVSFIKQWPEAMTWWHRYGEMIRQAAMERRAPTDALAFYRENRRPRYGLGWRQPGMDCGAEVYWEDRIDPPYDTALQTAMTKWLLDPEAMEAEWQNSPRDPGKASNVIYLDRDTIAGKTSSLDRGIIQPAALELVTFWDVQLEVIIWAVGAFAPDFAGQVVDYGTWPEQSRAYWTLDSLTDRISDRYQGEVQSRIRQALRDCKQLIQSRHYRKPGGQRVPVSLGLVDASFQRDAVFGFCRDEGDGLFWPDVGVGVTARSKPLNEGFKPDLGEEMGPYWQKRNDSTRGYQGYRHDANHYKTLVHRFFAEPELSPCSLTLFGGGDSHELYSDHLVGEYPTLTHGRERELAEWTLRPAERQDYFDCTAGLLVGASIRGITIPGTEGMYQAKRRNVPPARTWSQKDFR